MLALILAAAAAAAPATPADGSYTYVSTMNGATVAKSVVTVKHAANGVVLTEQGNGTFNGQDGSENGTLTLDPQTLSPTAYSVTANVGGRPMNMAVHFNGSNASQTGDVAQQSYALSPSQSHFVVLDIGPFSGWFALPSQMQAWNDAPACAIVPAMGQNISIAPSATAPAVRPAGVPASDQAMSVTAPMPFTLWFDPKTMLVDRLDFPTQGVTVTRQT